ncbi:MAG: response regulator transcription factor [Chloroflexi bacterium]|nr:response regulator transcription factor [Chloroflexota bacterium]
MRILLVDDHILFRKGLAQLLNSQPDFQVVGEAGDGFKALDKARELMPDLILMDINMPGCDGREATRLIKQALPYVVIVMLTVSDDDQDLFAALKNGAQGYLLKKMDPEDLFAQLRGLARGEAPLSRLLASRILNEFSRTAAPDAACERELTARERQVLQHVALGLTNREIAEKLVLSENTVKNHLRNILAKLHLENRVQAAAYALREGLVPIHSDK